MAHTLNDVWLAAAADILDGGRHVSPRALSTIEQVGRTMVLLEPHQRLLTIRERLFNPFLLIGEWLWLLRGARDLETMEYYVTSMRRFSDDGKTLQGAYGHRILRSFGVNQLDNIVEILTADRNSRRAFISIFDPSKDHRDTRDCPCITSMQFLIRDESLICMSHMRSQDIVLGMPYDIGWMTLMQELVAGRLGCQLGPYIHTVASMHIYEQDVDRVNHWLEQSPREGRCVPLGDVSDDIVQRMCQAEEEIRLGMHDDRLEKAVVDTCGLWKRMDCLLRAHRLWRLRRNNEAIAMLGATDTLLQCGRENLVGRSRN